MDMKIELVPVPVSDTDRAIEFYKKVGFNVDHDFKVQPGLRFVQLTPPGSACSVVIGEGTTDMKVGTQSIQMVVASAQAAHDQLHDNGIEVTDVETLDWGIFTRFTDPDGNQWHLQELVPQQS